MGSAQVQGELWGAKADAWANKAERTTAPLWEAILEATDVGLGTRLLDLGCGAGGLCVLAQERGARVAGMDASGPLLEFARSRLPGTQFKQADLEDLPYDPHTFDVVVACNSIQFAQDSKIALDEARRVLKPEGKFAIGMWCEPERCETIGVIRSMATLLPPPPADAPPPLNSRENLIALVESAGFRIVREGEVECPFIFSNLTEAWEVLSSAGIVVGMIRKVGEAPVKQAALEALSKYADGDGEVRNSNWFRYLIAFPRSANSG